MAARAWSSLSPGSASSLTSRSVMAEKRELKCVIAAGGTAGHVLPALAVAEALQERGVRVSFAGSPDRVEARLVPDAGYELDTFRSSGLPRRLGVGLAGALATAAGGPAACVRILRRRRPDVVLGGGGYVSGPMVLAAALRRTPAAVLEADAQLGLANRLAAPFAARVFLALTIEGLDGPKYRVTGRPVPRRSRAMPAPDARRRLDLPAKGSVVLVLGGSQGALRLNELAAERWGAAGPAVLHLCGERDYAMLRDRARASARGRRGAPGRPGATRAHATRDARDRASRGGRRDRGRADSACIRLRAAASGSSASAAPAYPATRFSRAPGGRR